MKTTIKILSDFHISNERLQNNFMLDEFKFIKYLDNVIKESDRVVILGDLFELWETNLPFLRRGKFKKIMRNGLIFKYIHKEIVFDNIIYIYGNHDYFLKKSSLIPYCEKSLILYINGCKIYFSHGHQPDIWNNGLARFGEFFTWLGAWFERFFKFNIDSKIVNNCIRREFVMLKYAKMKAKKYKADIVAFGHLHKYTKREDGNFTYITCGKVCGRNDYFDEVTIEVEDNGDYEVKHRLVRL